MRFGSATHLALILCIAKKKCMFKTYCPLYASMLAHCKGENVVKYLAQNYLVVQNSGSVKFSCASTNEQVGWINPVPTTALKCFKSSTLLVGVVDWPHHQEVWGPISCVLLVSTHHGVVEAH